MEGIETDPFRYIDYATFCKIWFQEYGISIFFIQSAIFNDTFELKNVQVTFRVSIIYFVC